MLLVASAAIAALALLPALREATPARHAAIALQIAWAVWTATMALLLPFVPRRWRLWLDRAALASPALFHGAIAGVSGGIHSPGFPWMAAIPIATKMFLKGDVRGVVLSSAASVLVTGALIWPEWTHGASALPLLQVLATSILAVFASCHRRARHRRERASQAERLKLARQLRSSERRRAAAERLAQVGRLAVSVAREASAPLEYVRSHLADLEEGLETGILDERERHQQVAGMHLELDRIGRIVDCLRTFSRASPVHAEECSLWEATRAAMRTLSPGMSSAIEMDIPFEATRTCADRPMLAGVLRHLLTNALEAAAAGTEIPRVRLSARRRDRWIDLFVDDSGAGVPESLWPRLFEPFFTTRPSGHGLGLGLAVAREQVWQMGGQLTLELNGLLGGARFRVTLPASGGSRPDWWPAVPPPSLDPADPMQANGPDELDAVAA